MKPPIAVIFDMDGLMLDTEAISLKAMQQTLRILKVPFEEQWLYDIIGMNKAGAMGYLEGKIGQTLPEALDETFIRIYDESVSRGIELKTGLIKLFQFLDENRIRRAVATSTRTNMARKKLTLTGIDHWFEHVVCGDQVENGKPAPDIYLKAVTDLGLEPEHCLALEDSDNGARAAHSAGLDVFVVPDLKQPSDYTRRIAGRVFESLHDVRTHLEDVAESHSKFAS